MAGLLTRPSVRFTVATSPSGVSRPYCAATTSYPSACSAGITLLKHEPSAQIPWQKTMLGLVCVDLFILEPPGDSYPLAALAPMVDRRPRKRLGESRRFCYFPSRG